MVYSAMQQLCAKALEQVLSEVRHESWLPIRNDLVGGLIVSNHVQDKKFSHLGCYYILLTSTKVSFFVTLSTTVMILSQSPETGRPNMKTIVK